MSLEYLEIPQDFNITLSWHFLLIKHVLVFSLTNFSKYRLESRHHTGQFKKLMKCSLEWVWPAQQGTQGHPGRREEVKSSKWRRKNRAFRLWAKLNYGCQRERECCRKRRQPARQMERTEELWIIVSRKKLYFHNIDETGDIVSLFKSYRFRTSSQLWGSSSEFAI